MSEASTKANEQSREHFASRYRAHVADQESAINRLQGEAARKLDELRSGTSHKLSAYGERQADPFYKLLDLQARLEEESDHYVIRARIPEHEQAKVTVSVQGDRIVLTGSRRNEERQELEPGHIESTNAFQTFTESFPILWPVDTRGMTRHSDGDWLTVTLPKKSRAPAPHYQPPVGKIAVDRPRFPEESSPRFAGG